MLKEFDEQILRQAVQSLALLGWAVYEPSRAPSLDYLLERRGADPFGTDKDKPVPADEAAWNALLDGYGFLRMDDFDRALLDGVRNGFFDPSLIKKLGSELDMQIKAGKLSNSFWDAWRMYHDSFADNEQDVLEAIRRSFIEGAKYITPLNLNGTVTLFKELGKPDWATEIIRHYVEVRGKEAAIFDLKGGPFEGYPFGGEIKDPDVVDAFAQKHATFKREQAEPAAILLRMADMNGWHPEDIAILSSLPVDTYYKVFKSTEGRDLQRILSSCLQFDTIGNASADMKEISRRAKEALKRIGQESLINARRVKRYGVEVDEKPT